MKVFTFTLSLTDYHHDLECLPLWPPNLSVHGGMGGGDPDIPTATPPILPLKGGLPPLPHKPVCICAGVCGWQRIGK